MHANCLPFDHLVALLDFKTLLSHPPGVATKQATEGVTQQVCPTLPKWLVRSDVAHQQEWGGAGLANC